MMAHLTKKDWKVEPARIRLLPCHTSLDSIATHHNLAETYDARNHWDEADREDDDESRCGGDCQIQTLIRERKRGFARARAMTYFFGAC